MIKQLLRHVKWDILEVDKEHEKRLKSPTFTCGQTNKKEFDPGSG